MCLGIFAFTILVSKSLCGSGGPTAEIPIQIGVFVKFGAVDRIVGSSPRVESVWLHPSQVYQERRDLERQLVVGRAQLDRLDGA